MVVYLYKKGRQTMKNIITTIAMFILTIGAQAQVYQFHCKGFYRFEHTSGLNSMEVLNNNQETKLMGGTSNIFFIFDSVKNTMTRVDSFNQSVMVRTIVDSHSENNYQFNQDIMINFINNLINLDLIIYDYDINLYMYKI